MNQFLLVKMSGAEPYERGVQYGQQAVREIMDGIRGYERHFGRSVGMTWEQIRENSERYIPLLEADCPDELAEARGIADGAKVDFKDIMALNCRYEILKLPLKECTSVSVLPEATGTGRTYLAQNWDYRPWVMENSVIVLTDNGRGTRILGITEGGQLVRNGMNNHGVGICANNLTSTSDDGAGIGVPVTFLRRKALNARSFQEADATISGGKRAVSCNYMLASSNGHSIDLETTPAEVFRLEPREGVLTHANHMVAGVAVCTNKGTKFRDVVLRRRIMERHGSIGIPYIMECLKDHERAPGSFTGSEALEAVCTHAPAESYDPDEAWQTIASVVYDLGGGCAYICKGTPCTGAYVKYDL